MLVTETESSRKISGLGSSLGAICKAGDGDNEGVFELHILPFRKLRRYELKWSHAARRFARADLNSVRRFCNLAGTASIPRKTCNDIGIFPCTSSQHSVTMAPATDQTAATA